MTVRHTICPECALVYLHTEGEPCPLCEVKRVRKVLREVLDHLPFSLPAELRRMAEDAADGVVKR